MYPIVDRNRTPLVSGQKVRVQFCTGRYGQTAVITGELVGTDGHGDVTVRLDHPFSHDTQKFGVHRYEAGDNFYVCDASDFDSGTQTWVGYKKHEDFEHGHEAWIEILPG